MNIHPLNDRIVIEVKKPEEKTASGLILPESAQEKPNIGKVIAVGSGRIDNGIRIIPEVSVDDEIIYGKYTGTEIEYENKKYLIMRESDILAILK